MDTIIYGVALIGLTFIGWALYRSGITEGERRMSAGNFHPPHGHGP